MFELPGTIKPVFGSVVTNTLQLESVVPRQNARQRRQRLFSPVLVVAGEKDDVLPAPGPRSP